MADEETKKVVAALILCVTTSNILKDTVTISRKRKRKVWVRDWLKSRNQRSAYFNLLEELRLNDENNFR